MLLKRTLAVLFVMCLSSSALSGCSTNTLGVEDLQAIDLRKSRTPPPSASSTDDTNYFFDPFSEFEIEDQSGEGKLVTLEEVRIGFELGFIAIFDAEGTLLGTAKVTEKSQPTVVKLDPAVLSNTRLIGQLFADDGDGVFNASSDYQVIDDDRDLTTEDFEYWVSN